MAEFDLNRFLVAQERDYATALAEMKNGAKLSHWIWYIFPQQKGLGHSTIRDTMGFVAWKRLWLTGIIQC